MQVESLELRQYRNLGATELSGFGMFSVFSGMNAQGKTNLLESLYILSMGRAFRTRWYRDLICFGKPEALLRSSLRFQDGRRVRLEIKLSHDRRLLLRDGVIKKSLSDYIGIMPVVVFSPADLALVEGPPAMRRRFLDHSVSQVLPAYLRSLREYQRLLLHRNQCLKHIRERGRHVAGMDAKVLETFDEQLWSSAERVWHYRWRWLRRLAMHALKIHGALTREKEWLSVQYLPSFPFRDAGDILSQTTWLSPDKTRIPHSLQMKEKRMGLTLWGPHRDEMAFFVDDRELCKFGSQGQKRTVVLAIKLAELTCLEEVAGDSPLLLLDDCFSELDAFRQEYLMEWVRGRVQTFVTSASPLKVDHPMGSGACIFDVVAGHVQRRTVGSEG